MSALHHEWPGLLGETIMNTVLALTIPADPVRPCAVVRVPATAVALSDAIGGGLLDEAVVVGRDEWACCVYADADREVRGLPANDRASGLVAGLTDGVPGTAGPDSPAASEWPPLRGDVLVTGLDTDGNDTDLPPAVLDQVTAAGLLPTGGHAGRISP